tara:strand:- start:105 stop:413 length:309 start_codon:yes stop_codon:yes gene_type:complete
MMKPNKHICSRRTPEVQGKTWPKSELSRSVSHLILIGGCLLSLRLLLLLRGTGTARRILRTLLTLLHHGGDLFRVRVRVKVRVSGRVGVRVRVRVGVRVGVS